MADDCELRLRLAYDSRDRSDALVEKQAQRMTAATVVARRWLDEACAGGVYDRAGVMLICQEVLQALKGGT